MADLQDTTITGAATVSSTLGVTGATTVGSTLGVTGTTTMAGATSTSLGVSGAATVGTTLGVSGTSTLGTTNMGAATCSTLDASGDFKITSGSPSQYRICRQQSGTSGLVQWIDFAVYDTNGTTRLF